MLPIESSYNIENGRFPNDNLILRNLPPNIFTKELAAKDIKEILNLLKRKAEPAIYLNRIALQALKDLLVIAKVAAIFACLVSLFYHHQIDQVRNFKTTEEYFLVFFPKDPHYSREKETKYSTYYSSYRHIGGRVKTDNPIEDGWYIIHHLMQGGAFYTKGAMLSPNPTYKFCDLHIFPEIANYTNAAPDSYYSIAILSISSFFWGFCMTLMEMTISLEIYLSKTQITQSIMTTLEGMAASHRIKNIHKKYLENLAKMIKDSTLH